MRVGRGGDMIPGTANELNLVGLKMLNRRDAMLRLGQLGVGGLALPALLRGRAAAGSSAGAKRGTADACIYVFLWGGPPQQDMWDMKPGAPEGIRSQFTPINTVTPGIQICDQLPQIAQHTDKMAIVRSYTHPSNAHEVGVYHTLTGKINNTLAVPRKVISVTPATPCSGCAVAAAIRLVLVIAVVKPQACDQGPLPIALVARTRQV